MNATAREQGSEAPVASGRARSVLLALYGLLLFLFIPLVLFLYLQQPFGPVVSIAFGLAIMFGHGFVAAPWMARHSTQRCLWCGRAGHFDRTFPVLSAGCEQLVAACSAAHHISVAQFLTFVARYRTAIAIGIFVPLLVLLVASLALAAGHPVLPQSWNAWQFKTIVAFTVVVTSFAYRAVRHASEPLRSPFPLHNLFLLGIRNTLWVFRLVGAWWLIAGVLQMWR
jgi:hypothetical protein